MQNTSHAVMAQRIEPKDSLDFFPTPPWATRALCEWIAPVDQTSVWEPACGKGDMSNALDDYFYPVYSSDVVDYGWAHDCKDFLDIKDHKTFDWIITNPPFNLADNFASQALRLANEGVALLVRTSFLEGIGRYKKLYSITPPTDILQFTERVPMHKGRLLAKGSTATAYCWVVWRKNELAGTRFHWIPPCRKALERPSDYGAF